MYEYVNTNRCYPFVNPIECIKTIDAFKHQHNSKTQELKQRSGTQNSKKCFRKKVLFWFMAKALLTLSRLQYQYFPNDFFAKTFEFPFFRIDINVKLNSSKYT